MPHIQLRLGAVMWSHGIVLGWVLGRIGRDPLDECGTGLGPAVVARVPSLEGPIRIRLATCGRRRPPSA